MNNKICIYDNNTGTEIPTKISFYPVDIMLGPTINDIHSNAGECILFVVITHISFADFIVPDMDGKNNLEKIPNFEKYNICIRESSMWYNKKAYSNIILSDTLNLSANEISSILIHYLDDAVKKIKKDNHSNIYIILNTRNNKEIFRTPNRDEAILVCNENACSVIIYKKTNKIIYRTNFGRISIPKNVNKLNSRFDICNK